MLCMIIYYKRRRYNWYKVTCNNCVLWSATYCSCRLAALANFFFFNITTIIIHNDDDGRSVESAVFRLRVGGRVLRVLLLVQRPKYTDYATDGWVITIRPISRQAPHLCVSPVVRARKLFIIIITVVCLS